MKTIPVAGDHHTILLSLDGSFLHVTQPLMGQVSVMRADTGGIFCTAHLPGTPALLSNGTTTNTLFAAGNDSSQVTALDPTNCKVQAPFGVSGPVYVIVVDLT
jgi:hypothetical protein